MIKKSLITTSLAICALSCGTMPQPKQTTQIPSTAHIITTQTSQITTATICGIHFIEIGGQVEDERGQIVGNGSYTTGGYYLANGFYITPCNYMILDGLVCQDACKSKHW